MSEHLLYMLMKKGKLKDAKELIKVNGRIGILNEARIDPSQTYDHHTVQHC